MRRSILTTMIIALTTGVLCMFIFTASTSVTKTVSYYENLYEKIFNEEKVLYSTGQASLFNERNVFCGYAALNEECKLIDEKKQIVEYEGEVYITDLRLWQESKIESN